MTTNQQSTNNVEQISVSKARSSSMPSINSVFAKIKTRHSSQKAITQKVPVPTQTQPISISPDLIEKKLQEEIDQVQASFVELENVQFGEEEGVGVNSEDGKVVAQIKPKKQTTMEVMKRITSFGAILNKVEDIPIFKTSLVLNILYALRNKQKALNRRHKINKKKHKQDYLLKVLHQVQFKTICIGTCQRNGRGCCQNKQTRKCQLEKCFWWLLQQQQAEGGSLAFSQFRRKYKVNRKQFSMTNLDYK
eukprot:TRINITY_DN32785_c0_g2_i5.p1 TRINITY_DN32785_c0_g2~~TRINITY_DN32785_c0_g2_i5.p1  ORF type:complete len:256 (-),score=17.88 TRINITY_DN32785_c0_g2_i5:61-807(-)